MKRAHAIRVAAAVSAAALIWLAATLPLWSMTMKAPQYPKGLRLEAYGTGMTGDLKEINILNHYIGMKPIDPKPPLETKLFPAGVAALIVLCLASPLNRWVRALAVTMTVATPLAILADLQWWLYVYGHSLNPKAPIRLKPFTPLVLGESAMGNFVSSSMVSTGFLCLAGAAVILVAGGRLGRRYAQHPSTRRVRAAAAAVSALMLAGSDAEASNRLQALIDAAPAGSTVTVPRGIYTGSIRIRGPLTLIGEGVPIIDGDGRGSVVTIEGDGVVFRGFGVRNSGRNVTEEAAGIKASGSRHRIEWNDVRDVYFGIHVSGGGSHVIEHNIVEPGESHGARPGHGISIWNTADTRIAHNAIRHGRDGVYLSFTKRVQVVSNQVGRCRYGLHSMYSEQAVFAGNTLTANLLGSALMNSDRLELRGNRIEQHRAGSAAYGILLKDIGDLVAEDNVIIANRVGLYAEGVPDRPGRTAVMRRNIFAGNDVGIALQANAALTFTANRIAENLTDVRALGSRLAPDTAWSSAGVGNSWSQYRGFDRDGDGIGDLAHRLDEAAALTDRNDSVRAFLYTPAHLALEAGARLFPLFRRAPLLVDEHPLMRWHAPRPR